MNLQISIDINNEKLELNILNEGIKTIYLDGIRNIDNFIKLDGYMYLGDIKKRNDFDNAYDIIIRAIQNKKSNQFYFLENHGIRDENINGFIHNKGNYVHLMERLMSITYKPSIKMNLQISPDIKNKKLKINISEEGIKTIYLDEIKNIDNFIKLDDYVYLGNIEKRDGCGNTYDIIIYSIQNKKSNQIYFLEKHGIRDENINGFIYDKGNYESLMEGLMIITDKPLTKSIDLIKLTREGIQRVSKELSVKDIPLYPSRIDWIWELNLNMQLLLVKYNLYPKISDTLVGLIENLDNKLQVSLLINSGIVKWEIVERYFKIRIKEDKVCFTFIDYNENIKESVDENSAIAYLLRYMYSKPKKSRVVPSDAFTLD